MSQQVEIKATNVAPPQPQCSVGFRSVIVVFYNRDLQGNPYGALEFQFGAWPEQPPRKAINWRAFEYMRDHFAIYGEGGKLLSDGPRLNALGQPDQTYAEQRERAA